MDVRVPFSTAQVAFGTQAVVTRPGDTASITATVVWMPPDPSAVPVGMDLQALSMRKVLAVPKATVPTCPQGTVIVVAEQDGNAAERFVVEGPERAESDHHRVLVKKERS